MSAIATAENPLLTRAGPARLRTAQAFREDVLPAGVQLVSADDHWEVTQDIFYEQLPARFKDVAPRVWFDKVWWSAPRTDGGVTGVPAGIPEDSLEVFENLARVPGYSREGRAQDLAAEGPRKSIVFPNSILFYMHHPDLELREEIFKIYNRYIAAESEAQDGFYGVGVFPNWWDGDKAWDQIKALQDLGLKTFMLPTQPRGGDGKAVSYADPRFEPFWSALERSGMPLCLHIGEGFNFQDTDKRALLAPFLQQMAPFRLPLAQMIFGGVFERHPAAKVVFAEGGISWVAPFLQDAEQFYDTYGQAIQPIPQRPGRYWRNNCYATFQTDLLGLTRLLDVIGPDRVMWAADYPHTEGTFGYTTDSVRQVIDNVSPEDARMILGDTAMKVFRLD